MAAAGGSLITMTYLGAERVIPAYNVRGVAKAALETSVKYLAADLGPDGIRVNAVNPVIGETAMAVEFMGGEDRREIRGQFIATIPLGRVSTPEDVANAVLYLASDEAAFITGVCLEVDGGRCV